MAFFFLISGCKKTTDELKDEVVYTVTEISGSQPDFIVYYAVQGSTKSEGPLKQGSWISKPIHGFERGDYVMLDIFSKGGTGSFNLSIYLNRVQLASREVNFPTNDTRLEAILPPGN